METGESEESKTYQYLVLLLGLASLVLATATVYMMQILSIGYGVWATLQNIASKTNLTANLTQTTAQMVSLNSSMREVYIIAFIAFGMLGSALVMYIARYRRFGALSRRYSLMHMTLTVIYIALFFIVLSDLSINYASIYFLLVYAAMAVALGVDIYIEFAIHSSQSGERSRSGMQIEPNAPYSNLVKLRESIFSKLHGDVRIVDKHFNSDAIANLHRLLETNLNRINKLEILTSKEMFDMKFQENYTDFRNELKNAGVELDFMLMSNEDMVAQHERFIFDDERAYKIPPLNIINKKSEHVVDLRLGEVRSRFNSLIRNATKYDNYVVKQARGPGTV
ncbi:MAG: hypothetical protein ABSD68_04110 [Candidatus Micrarchaeales archaeon]